MKPQNRVAALTLIAAAASLAATRSGCDNAPPRGSHPAVVEKLDDETLRVMVSRAEAGDKRAMGLVAAYYLEKGMEEQAEMWLEKRRGSP